MSFHRTELEKRMHELILVDVYLSHDGDLSVPDALVEVNTVLRGLAAERCEREGIEGDEADEIIRAAEVSQSTLNADMKRIRKRVREAAELGAAGLLDRQLESVRDDLERHVEQRLEDLRTAEAGIMSDIERCRIAAWGKDSQGSEGEPINHSVAYTTIPRLWKQFLDCHDKCAKLVALGMDLRAEERMLWFGKKVFESETGKAAEAESFVQAISQAGTPEEAKKVAMEQYAVVLDELQGDHAQILISMPDELQKAHKSKVQSQKMRVDLLKGYIDMVSGGNGRAVKQRGNGHGHTLELMVRGQ